MVLQLAEGELETFGKLKLKNLLKGVVKGIKKLSLAPMRHSFLSLVILNAFHFATRLKKQIDSGREGALKSKWEKLGGSYAELKKIVLSGAKKKGFLEDYQMEEGISFQRMCEIHNEFEETGDATLSEEETFGAVQLAAVLAAATSIMVALKPFLKKSGGEDTSPEITDPSITQSMNPVAALDPTTPENEPKFDKSPVGTSQGMDFKKVALFGGLGLLGIFAVSKLGHK